MNPALRGRKLTAEPPISSLIGEYVKLNTADTLMS
jgi:hypothetical protein